MCEVRVHSRVCGWSACFTVEPVWPFAQIKSSCCITAILSDAFCLTLIQTMLCMSASSNSILAVNHAKECPLLLCFIFFNPRLAYPHVSCSWCSPLTFPSPSYTSHSPTPSPPSSLYSPRSPLFPPPLSIYLPISWHFFRRRYDAWHFPLAPPMHA